MIGLLLAPLLLASQQTPSHDATRNPSASQTAVVSGVVYDSVVGAPIAGAVVQFAALERGEGNPVFVTRSDDVGRYELRDVPTGRYLVGFEHIALDSLGIEPTSREVDIGEGAERVPLATPSPYTIATAICGERTEDDSTALLLGHVRETGTEMAIAGATVTVEWTAFVLDASGFNARNRIVSAETVGPGWFALCGLPSDAVLTTRAGHGSDSTGYVEVRLPPGELRHLTYLLGGGERVTIAIRDSVAGADSSTVVAGISRTVWRGGARLTGVVRNRDNEPVAGAHLSLWGTDAEAVTNDRGVFALDGLPGGTQTLETSLIGWVPVRQTVQLTPGRTNSVDVTIGDRVTVLSAIETRGELVYSEALQGFERRRRSGWGQYITPAEIQRMPMVSLGSLLQQMHGVRVVCFRGECNVSMRRPATQGLSGYEYCKPSLYVDGMRDMVGDFDFLWKDRILAIEVYREAFRPSEFRDLNPCGAVAVWTRPRPQRIRSR